MNGLPKLRVEQNWMDALMAPHAPKWEVKVNHPTKGVITYASFRAWRDAYDWARSLAEQITEQLEAKS